MCIDIICQKVFQNYQMSNIENNENIKMVVQRKTKLFLQ